jgi:hypothetical protein
MAEAEQLDAVNQERARKARLQDLANAMQETDERNARHAALRRKHGLHEAASPRDIADAEIGYDRAWRNLVGCRFANSGQCAEILSPEIVDEQRRPEVLALRDKLREQFEASYARDVAARPVKAPEQVTDGVRQLYGHQTGVAA